MEKKRIYRINFYNQGNVYELYAHHVAQSNMYAFIEVEDIIFDKRTELLVDPTEEKLKNEFMGVTRTYIPMQSIIRIDEVEKHGSNKIIPTKGAGEGKITPFPFTLTPPGNKPGGS